jgi:putative ATP-dependent endonuclease of OLD family
MRLEMISFRGFRCFDPSHTVAVKLETLTALVGANGAGKSAILVGLLRLFGASRSQRAVVKEDFHIADAAADVRKLSFEIEARFSFPEALDDKAALTSRAVPECLRHIVVGSDSAEPICRIRLSATWTAGPTAEGDIDEEIHWINSVEEDPPAEALTRLSGIERSLISVLYVPAQRDAGRELRAVSGTLLGRLLRRAAWSPGLMEALDTISKSAHAAIGSEPALNTFEASLQRHWGSLRASSREQPSLAIADGDLEGVLRRLSAKVDLPGRRGVPLELLSEGERSLMYFALIQSVLEIEANPGGVLLPEMAERTPVLTILAVEEPENHLGPQYLSRILASLRSIADLGSAQVAITSHSASILRRVEPSQIRHVRSIEGGRRVTGLTLPLDVDEAFKYVRNAVQAHPELYFASFVILCEGASEEVALPIIAKANGIDIDPKFVAVVPLGGRHVNHFWRLLRDLGTPFATLIDLDSERAHGGWARVHNLGSELILLGEPSQEIRGGLSEKEFDDLRDDPISDLAYLQEWLDYLEQDHKVFVSAPLDFDWMLFQAHREHYQALDGAARGPNFPVDPGKLAARLQEARRVTLGSGGRAGVSYADVDGRDFAWYSYLFIGGSKPATHSKVLSGLDEETIRSRCPAPIARLLNLVRDQTAGLGS